MQDARQKVKVQRNICYHARMKKIVIIGPESTGKSSLAQALAAHFNGNWVREFARDYLTEHGTDYSFADLLTIAQGQLTLEDAAVREPAPYLFLDTDMHVMHVWSTFVFGQEHEWIERERRTRQYDMYLLACPDLPWTRDHLREYPDLETRERLYLIYRDILLNQTTPWAEVRGIGEARVQCAVEAVSRICESGSIKKT
ncbi:MAG: AAA family ATPase [Formosimonas sp.]